MNVKTASDIMVKPVKTVQASATLIEAHQQMQNLGVHHLLVVGDDGQLIGVLSDRDVKKFASPFAGSERESQQDRATMDLPVQKIASKNVTTCQTSDPIRKCLELMLGKSIHAIPVIDNKQKLVGLVTSTDLLKLMLDLL